MPKLVFIEWLAIDNIKNNIKFCFVMSLISNREKTRYIMINEYKYQYTINGFQNIVIKS